MMSEWIRKFTLEIYRLPLGGLLGYAVLGALIFRLLWRALAGRPWLRPWAGGVLAVWAAVVLWMTLLSRSGGGVYEAQWIPLHTYRALLRGTGRDEFRSGMMNVALFYPAGLLFGGLWGKKRDFWRGLLRTVVLFGVFSLALELGQYWFRLGVSEIDDVLHNTLGAAAGYAAFRLEPAGRIGMRR